MIKGHGGNIYDAARQLGCRPADILDMSSNFNPLGPPPELMEHLQAALAAVKRLPEVDAGTLAEAYARNQGRLPGEILAGGGTTQFIYALPRALDSRRALICGPTYADYRDACAQQGVDAAFAMSGPETDFRHDPRKVARLAGEADLIFICNPNNPTGVLWPEGEIQGLARAHPDRWFVVDESYLPMVPEGERYSLIGWAARDLPNVIVLDSCSKIYRIPGLRIGFLAAAEPVVERLKPLGLPWNVNGLAQAAGAFLMSRHEELARFVAATRSFLAAERKFMADGLADVPGLRLFPSHTSYLLLKLPRGITADRVCRGMLEKRILIRDCANFKGLSNGYVRISLKEHPDNARGLQILREVLLHLSR